MAGTARLGTALLPSLLAAALIPPSAASFTLEPVEGWRSFFGGIEQEYHFRVTGGDPVEARIGWSLSYERRSIARGEQEFADGDKEEGVTAIRFALPEPREGVVMPLTLRVELYDVRGGSLLAVWEDTLRLFSRDPFVHERQWLKSLAVGLFDPLDETSVVLESFKIPFARLRNPGSIEDFDGSLLIVGGGVDFTRHRGLWEDVVAAARRGMPVLVLAPASGTVRIADAGGKSLLGPASLGLGREEVIQRMDAKLDAYSWPPDGRVSAAFLALRGDPGGVAGEFSADPGGWPWLEADFPGSGAKMIVCGFDVVAKIDAGPAPRFLLARMLKYLAETEGRKERSTMP